jgi:hypothetical protein
MYSAPGVIDLHATKAEAGAVAGPSRHRRLSRSVSFNAKIASAVDALMHSPADPAQGLAEEAGVEGSRRHRVQRAHRGERRRHLQGRLQARAPGDRREAEGPALRVRQVKAVAEDQEPGRAGSAEDRGRSVLGQTAGMGDLQYGAQGIPGRR